VRPPIHTHTHDPQAATCTQHAHAPLRRHGRGVQPACSSALHSLRHVAGQLAWKRHVMSAPIHTHNTHATARALTRTQHTFRSSVTRHQTTDTRHQAPGTRHQTTGTRHQAPGTRHQAPGTRHQAPCTRQQTAGTRQHTTDPHGQRAHKDNRPTQAGSVHTEPSQGRTQLKPNPHTHPPHTGTGRGRTTCLFRCIALPTPRAQPWGVERAGNECARPSTHTHTTHMQPRAHNTHTHPYAGTGGASNLPVPVHCTPHAAWPASGLGSGR
jgi:hypothetical protein